MAPTVFASARPSESVKPLAALAPDAEWTEAEGFPYAGTYKGVEAILTGVFHRLGTEWIGYRAEVHTFMEDGDRVAAFGVYSGTYKATGRSMRAAFARRVGRLKLQLYERFSGAGSSAAGVPTTH